MINKKYYGVVWGEGAPERIDEDEKFLCVSMSPDEFINGVPLNKKGERIDSIAIFSNKESAELFIDNVKNFELVELDVNIKQKEIQPTNLITKSVERIAVDITKSINHHTLVCLKKGQAKGVTLDELIEEYEKLMEEMGLK